MNIRATLLTPSYMGKYTIRNDYINKLNDISLHLFQFFFAIQRQII